MYLTFNLVGEYGFSVCVQFILLTIGEYESDLIMITLLGGIARLGPRMCT